ncbi:MAG TPA: Calx-beta domain-containing protein [Thermoleophilaceae bacterium]
MAAAALVGVALLLALVPLAPAVDDCTVSWDGGAGTGRWQDAANWSGDSVPGLDAVACIPAGASVRQELGGTVAGLRGEGTLTVRGGVFTVTGAASLGRLSVEGGTTEIEGFFEVPALAQTAGTVQGAGTLSADDFAWSGGVQQGDGTTAVRAATLTGGTHSVAVDRKLMVDSGAVVAWEAGALELRDSAQLLNAGLLDIRGDQDLTGAGAGQILNLAEGVIRKTGGSADTFVAYPISNDGTVEARAGSLTLHGGVTSVGSLSAGDGATVRLVGDSRLLPGSRTTSSGTGRVLFTGPASVAGSYDARTVVDSVSAAVSFEGEAAAPRLELRRGFLMGAGSIATPDLDWSGGTMSAAGETRIVPGGAGLAVSGSAGHALAGRTLAVEAGATVRVAERSIVLSDGALLDNAGRVELADGTKLDQGAGAAPPLVHNRAGGVLTKSGPGRASVSPPATNDGTVEATSGTLAFSSVTNLAGGRLSGGTWVVSATLELPNRVERNAARLILDGRDALVWDAFGRADGLRPLVANEAAGELRLENEGALATGPLTNEGAVHLGRDAGLVAWPYRQDSGTTTLASAGSRLISAGVRAAVRGGVLRGIGTVTGGLVNGGEVRPGLSPGTLSVEGDFDQTDTGILEIEIGGVGLADRDLLDVSRAARFAGALRVKTLAPFLPGPLDEFDVVRHASVAGAFERVEGLEVDAQHRYAGPQYEVDATWLRSNPPREVAIGDVVVSEGAGEAVFEVRVSQPWRGGPVGFARAWDGTAVEPDDYRATAEPVSIGAGETVGYLRVPIADDALDEPDETFEVRLTETLPGDTTAIATIVDDDQPEPEPEPAPDPDPEPDPAPDPEPDPDPAPHPDPDPGPTPLPDPTPDPDPDPTPTPPPDPSPKPDPDPDPKPDPDPNPTPIPDPGPAPEPSPTPIPEPDPTPTPEPDPGPWPNPVPGPAPEPEPEPGPTPAPDPTAPPQPDPAPAPSAGPAALPASAPFAPAAPEPAPAPAGERGAGLPVPPPPAPPRDARRPCPDRLSPRSSFRPHRHPIHATRASLHFRGIAWERGCGALDRVTVAIARREGGGTGLCRYLQPSGRLGQVVSCRRPTYVRARGTTSWTFRRAGRFPTGTWTARIRAVDRAGNAEKKVLKPNPLSRNFVTFKIR